jgi:hypothetical protein
MKFIQLCEGIEINNMFSYSSNNERSYAIYTYKNAAVNILECINNST